MADEETGSGRVQRPSADAGSLADGGLWASVIPFREAPVRMAEGNPVMDHGAAVEMSQ